MGNRKGGQINTNACHCSRFPLLPLLTDFCRQLSSKRVNLDQFFLAIASTNKGFLLLSDESKLVPLLISERN